MFLAGNPNLLLSSWIDDHCCMIKVANHILALRSSSVHGCISRSSCKGKAGFSYGRSVTFAWDKLLYAAGRISVPISNSALRYTGGCIPEATLLSVRIVRGLASTT